MSARSTELREAALMATLNVLPGPQEAGIRLAEVHGRFGIGSSLTTAGRLAVLCRRGLATFTDGPVRLYRRAG